MRRAVTSPLLFVLCSLFGEVRGEDSSAPLVKLEAPITVFDGDSPYGTKARIADVWHWGYRVLFPVEFKTRLQFSPISVAGDVGTILLESLDDRSTFTKSFVLNGTQLTSLSSSQPWINAAATGSSHCGSACTMACETCAISSAASDSLSTLALSWQNGNAVWLSIRDRYGNMKDPTRVNTCVASWDAIRVRTVMTRQRIVVTWQKEYCSAGNWNIYYSSISLNGTVEIPAQIRVSQNDIFRYNSGIVVYFEHNDTLSFTYHRVDPNGDVYLAWSRRLFFASTFTPQSDQFDVNRDFGTTDRSLLSSDEWFGPTFSNGLYPTIGVDNDNHSILVHFENRSVDVRPPFTLSADVIHIPLADSENFISLVSTPQSCNPELDSMLAVYAVRNNVTQATILYGIVLNSSALLVGPLSLIDGLEYPSSLKLFPPTSNAALLTFGNVGCLLQWSNGDGSRIFVRLIRVLKSITPGQSPTAAPFVASTTASVVMTTTDTAPTTATQQLSTSLWWWLLLLLLLLVVCVLYLAIALLRRRAKRRRAVTRRSVPHMAATASVTAAAGTAPQSDVSNATTPIVVTNTESELARHLPVDSFGAKPARRAPRLPERGDDGEPSRQADRSPRRTPRSRGGTHEKARLSGASSSSRDTPSDVGGGGAIYALSRSGSSPRSSDGSRGAPISGGASGHGYNRNHMENAQYGRIDLASMRSVYMDIVFDGGHVVTLPVPLGHRAASSGYGELSLSPPPAHGPSFVGAPVVSVPASPAVSGTTGYGHSPGLAGVYNEAADATKLAAPLATHNSEMSTNERAV